MKLSRTKGGAAAAAMTALAVALAGCGGGSSGDPAAAGGGDKDKVTLRVSLFGRFGYTDLYKEYKKANPHVTIVEAAEGDLASTPSSSPSGSRRTAARVTWWPSRKAP